MRIVWFAVACAAPSTSCTSGTEHVICCWEVDGVLVDPGPAVRAWRRCSRRSAASAPRALLLTHIHLDHAGATGALVRRWPDLPVYVHERGAPHLVDPAQLVASAARLYGGEDGWRAVGRGRAGARGEPARPRGRRDGVEGAFRVEYTPGHASHHVCYLHEPTGGAFVGDVAGVRIPPSSFTLAPTPPPDIDVEAWDALARPDRRPGSRTALGAHPLRPRRPTSPSSSSASARALHAPGRAAPRSTTRTASSRPARRSASHERAGDDAERDPRRPPRRTSSTWASSATAQAERRGYPPIDGSRRSSCRASRGPGTGLGGNWRVIVRNDDHNTFDGVAARARALLPGVSDRPGLRRSPTAIHNSGQAIVWAGTKEPAELYWEQLQRRGAHDGPARAGLRAPRRRSRAAEAGS